MCTIEGKCKEILLLIKVTETEYLASFLTRDGIKPQPKKVQDILMLPLPQNVKQLCRFLGMVQYFRDHWVRHSEMQSPLTNLVGECGHTNATMAAKTKRKPWHVDSVHQTAFNNIKTTIPKDVVLAYPDYTQNFKV
jgi:hypothetical protein